MATSSAIAAFALVMAGIRSRTERAVARLWQQQGTYDEADIEQWLAAVLPIIAAVQAVTVSATDAYLARALEDDLLGIDPLEAVALASGAEASVLYSAPFRRVWHKLAQGESRARAIAAGRQLALGTASEDIQRAMLGANEVSMARRPFHQSYRRVLNPGACEFCWTVAGITYSRGNLMKVHRSCHCTVEPIPDRAYVSARPGTSVRNAGERIDQAGRVVDKPTAAEERARKHPTETPATGELEPTPA